MYQTVGALRAIGVALALAFGLSGCATIDVAGPAPEAAADAPPAFYHNPGRAISPPRVAAWAGHLVRMAARTYPQREALPPGHVLSAAEAERGFVAARGARLSLTWFGHATFLIRMNGVNILTDPVLGEKVGVGPLHLHRLVPLLPDPALIERVDVIVVSHADFDHLDMPSLRALARRFPDAAVLVPRGTAFLARRAGFADVRELGWYDESRHGRLRVTAVPAIHGVRRPPFPVDAMHWAGFVLDDGASRIYFSGDTAASDLFAETRRRLGPVDVALVPAGAWAPRRFQAPYHASPEEAAAIARTLGARLAVGMHWGTFALSADAPTEQQARFLAASTPTTPTAVLRIGETRVLAR